MVSDAKANDENPAVVLIFGHNCAGKSTVGQALAGLFEKGAFIEVDELRYKVVGGLVAYSGGAKPKDAPEEYAAQCRLGEENTVLLARNYATHGFSSVIEGLGEDCRPGTGWAEAQFGELPVLHVLLMCDHETALARMIERGWKRDGLSKGFKRDQAWYQDNQEQFDITVSTDEHSVVEAAQHIYERVRS